ncbi:TolC family protein [Pleurocapsa sp. PCC 7319]|uniref:TolC family protein n=1 Tax=Pleurocapsa sp. PCC 7319 TaxID=118161 RepID=UPI0003473673|nr:TolC family protein [Pleurocapsa sp. PCC 7319]
MNDTVRGVKAIAIGVPIILCTETPTKAEDVVDINHEQNNQKIVKFQSNTAQDLTHSIPPLTVNQAKVENDDSSLIAKSLTQSQVDSASTFNNLNSSANPLQIPAKTQEVQIETNQPITLEKAIEIAIRNNQNLQIARLNLERSQRELREAKAALFPTFDTQLNLSEANTAESEIELELARQQEIENIDEDTSNSSFDGRLNFTYDLYTGGGRGADIKRAKNQVRLSELELEEINFETRFETVRDYYSLQNTDSQVEIEQSAVEDAQQTLKDAQLLQQAGLGTKFDVLSAEVELADAQQRLTTAKAEQKEARRQLATTLSVGQQVELKTADPIKLAGDWQLSLEETIITAYKNRAELEQFLVQREINEKQKQIELASVRPQVSFVASYNLLDVHDDDVGLSDGYTIGARLNWTLFDGGGARARAKQSETDIKINETEFANQRNQIRFEVEQGYYALTASQKNITTSKQAVKLADEGLSLARLRFQSGVGTQTDVIQAQTRLTSAKANYLQAIINYNQSLNELDRAVTNLPDKKV